MRVMQQEFNRQLLNEFNLCHPEDNTVTEFLCNVG